MLSVVWVWDVRGCVYRCVCVSGQMGWVDGGRRSIKNVTLCVPSHAVCACVNVCMHACTTQTMSMAMGLGRRWMTGLRGSLSVMASVPPGLRRRNICYMCGCTCVWNGEGGDERVFFFHVPGQGSLTITLLVCFRGFHYEQSGTMVTHLGGDGPGGGGGQLVHDKSQRRQVV